MKMHIKIKNGHLTVLTQILDSLKMSVKESRMRTRFIRMLLKYNDEVLMPQKTVILEEFCTKSEEDGRPLFKDKQKGEYLFEDPEQEDKAKKELLDFLNEEYILQCDEYNKMMILSVANSLLESEDFQVSGELADVVDGLCEQFELAIEYYNQEKEENIIKKEKKKKNK